MLDLTQTTTAKLDRQIGVLENRLRNNAGDKQAARNLTLILDSYVPDHVTSGKYTECQRALSSGIGNDFRFSDLLVNGEQARRYKQWWALLRKYGVRHIFPVAQLVTGEAISIHGEHPFCGLRLKLFGEQGVISRICHDCFKVQILPTNLTGMFKLYFILRDLRLPRDNARKCMIELRDDVPYPYKGYIYCQSEEEVKLCRDVLVSAFESHGISDQICAISHGCSEYGLKYPSFKYSPDGAHNDFQGPEEWDRLEKEFFADQPQQNRTMGDNNSSGITIKDLIGFRTWVDYAEIIGDQSWRQFQDGTDGKLPKGFAMNARRQATKRREQLAELRGRLEQV